MRKRRSPVWVGRPTLTNGRRHDQPRVRGLEIDPHPGQRREELAPARSLANRDASRLGRAQDLDRRLAQALGDARRRLRLERAARREDRAADARHAARARAWPSCAADAPGSSRARRRGTRACAETAPAAAAAGSRGRVARRRAARARETAVRRCADGRRSRRPARRRAGAPRRRLRGSRSRPPDGAAPSGSSALPRSSPRSRARRTARRDRGARPGAGAGGCASGSSRGRPASALASRAGSISAPTRSERRRRSVSGCRFVGSSATLPVWARASRPTIAA